MLIPLRSAQTDVQMQLTDGVGRMHTTKYVIVHGTLKR
jgi:hypothetical protein